MTNWIVCSSCLGNGKKKQKSKKNNKLSLNDTKNIQIAKHLNKTDLSSTKYILCKKCNGLGILMSDEPINADTNIFPHVAIIGLGIAGVTLAVACLHRGIPFSIFERDTYFSQRSQGYGLTLQQASKITNALGISNFENGIVSTKHIVFDTNGTVLGSWGKRKWLSNENEKSTKKTNLHIARQELRLKLIDQLNENKNIFWNHRLVDLKSDINTGNELTFLVNGEKKVVQSDLIVGADGIRSIVQNKLFQNKNPLKYLGCIVILGICELDKLAYLNSELLDSETVFQTANGNERIYVMPYSKKQIMWQLSFPMQECDAISLSKKGAHFLKNEAINRTKWHSPIPEIILNTEISLITGYPVYDREALKTNLSLLNKPVTLIGDAAHPMSPFKGQGANQAMIDGLHLARTIYLKYKFNDLKKINIREAVLNQFETEMFERSNIKVNESAQAAIFLHTEAVLNVSDQPRRKIE